MKLNAFVAQTLRGNAVKPYTKAMQGIVGASLSKMFPESRSTFGKRIGEHAEMRTWLVDGSWAW